MGLEAYVRVPGNEKHRNRSYNRSFILKNIGEIQVEVSCDREDEFKIAVISKSRQHQAEIGRKISPSEISNVDVELTEAVLKLCQRDLSLELVKYLFVDGVHFNIHLERIIVLVAIWVTETGQKLVLSLQSGETSWREFFKDLKYRGLDGGHFTPGIMDGDYRG